MGKQELTAERLREVLSYDPDTGVFTRKVRTAQSVRVGDVAGTRHICGYWQINVFGALYLAHRLAWLYTNGEWPAAEIDHINGNRLDNRICNLRAATRHENGSNLRKPKSTNTSGYLGVTWSKQRRKWAAQITVNRKGRVIGFFEDPAEAGAAYLQAKRELHGFCTI
jgi:hypothetical protein